MVKKEVIIKSDDFTYVFKDVHSTPMIQNLDQKEKNKKLMHNYSSCWKQNQRKHSIPCSCENWKNLGANRVVIWVV